jgi:hypothetical protein
VVAAYAVLAVAEFWSAWSGPPGTYVGIAGDAQTHMWYLVWLPFALAHLHNPLFSTYLGYPRGMNAMWNAVDAFPVIALLLQPVTRTLGVVTAYNLLATAAPVLSAAAAYWAILRLVASRAGAFAGGLLYGFSPYMAAHSLGHIGLTLAYTPPLLLLLGHELVTRRRLPPLAIGLIAGALLAAQYYIAEEYVATETLTAVLAAAVAALLRPRAAIALVRPAAVALGGVLLAFLPLAAPGLREMFLGPQRIVGVIRPPEVYVNDLLNLVLPTPVNLIRPAWTQPIVGRFTGNSAEWDGYVGVALLALLAITVIWRGRDLRVRFAAPVCAVLALASLGPHLHVGGSVTSIPLLWQVQHVRLLQQVLPVRLMMYFQLFAGVLLAVFVEALGTVRPTVRWGGAALVAASLALLIPVWPYPSTRTPVPSFFGSGAAAAIPQGDVVLVAPFARFNYDAVEWQAVSGMRFKMPEGNFLAPLPGGVAMVGPPHNSLSDAMEAIYAGDPAPSLDPARRAGFLGDLRAMGARHVIVGPMPHEDAMVDLFTGLLGRPPVDTGGVHLWLDAG